MADVVFQESNLKLAWISSDYFESLLLPQLLREENDSKQSDEFQANLKQFYFSKQENECSIAI